jgi:hypothetical protein
MGLGGVVLAWVFGHAVGALAALGARSRSVRAGGAQPLLASGSAQRLGRVTVVILSVAIGALLAGLPGAFVAAVGVVVMRARGPRALLPATMVVVLVAAIATVVEGGSGTNSFATQHRLATAAGQLAGVLLAVSLIETWHVEWMRARPRSVEAS